MVFGSYSILPFLKYHLSWVIELSQGNGTKGVPKVQKTHLLLPLGSSLRPFYFISLSSTKGGSLFLSRRECNTLLALSLLTFLCMYYMILLLVTDEYTELIFILLHFIYLHKYIYIKMFTIRF